MYFVGVNSFIISLMLTHFVNIITTVFIVSVLLTFTFFRFRFLPLYQKVFLYEIIFVGLSAGLAATYSAFTDLIENKFTVPCYVDPIKACTA